MPKHLEERNALVSAMAERCGADVEEGFRKALISPREYREFLGRCATCEREEACLELLAEPKGGAPSEAPDYCRNKAEIAALKERLDRVRR